MEPLSCIRSNFWIRYEGGKKVKQSGYLSRPKIEARPVTSSPTGILPPASIVQVDGFNVNSN